MSETSNNPNFRRTHPPELPKPSRGVDVSMPHPREWHYNAFLKNQLGPDFMCVINDDGSYGMLGEEVSITPASQPHHATHYQSNPLPFHVVLKAANTLTNEYGFINPKHFSIINQNEGSTLVITREGLQYAEHNAAFALRVPHAPLIDMKNLDGFAAKVIAERTPQESEQRALALLSNIADSAINQLGWKVDDKGDYVITGLAEVDFQHLGEALNEERISYRVPQSDFAETGEQIRPHSSMIISASTMRGITEKAVVPTR